MSFENDGNDNTVLTMFFIDFLPFHGFCFIVKEYSFMGLISKNE